MIKGIIFDLGHTLLEMTRDLDEVLREGAEAMADWYLTKKRIKLDQTALIETFLAERAAAVAQAEQTWTEVPLLQVLATTLDKIEAPAAAQSKILMEAAVKIFYGPEQAAWRAYPDAVSTLQALKRRDYRLGLYSNANDDAFVQRLINENKLRPELSITFSSAGQGWCKPDPRGFALIAKRWQLPAEQIVVVGDNLLTDIMGAHNAGMLSILVRRDAVIPTGSQPTPTAVVDSLAALPEVIAGL